MGYSVKWVVDNLGITRDMLRYYEKENLLVSSECRNPTNQYRDYSDEDIEKIWCIKLLISIGFSAKEIYAFMYDASFDFDTAIAKKVAELEKKHDENVICLEFAKTIKLTGRVPTVSKMGNIRFEDFLAYSRDNWNYNDDPRCASLMKFTDKLVQKEQCTWLPEDVKQIINMFEDSDMVETMHLCVLHGYYQVISDMREFGYTSDVVQKVVRLLHEHLIAHNMEPELDGKITSAFIAKYTAPLFLRGDIAVQHRRNYGKEGCLFIAQALAYYGGYDVKDL